MNELPVWLRSSQNPDEVANKVRGLILASSSVIIFSAAHLLHITLTPNDVVALGTDLSGVAGAVWAIYGTVLHLVTWLARVKTQ